MKKLSRYGKEYEAVTQIPEVFLSHSEDADYFTPATDIYVVEMVTYPTVPFYNYDFVEHEMYDYFLKEYQRITYFETVVRADYALYQVKNSEGLTTVLLQSPMLST